MALKSLPKCVEHIYTEIEPGVRLGPSLRGPFLIVFEFWVGTGPYHWDQHEPNIPFTKACWTFESCILGLP